MIVLWCASAFAFAQQRPPRPKRPPQPPSSGSGSDYLQQTENKWQGPWFTGSCKIYIPLDFFNKDSIKHAITHICDTFQLASVTGGRHDVASMSNIIRRLVAEESVWIVRAIGMASIVRGACRTTSTPPSRTSEAASLARHATVTQQVRKTNKLIFL